MSARKAPVRQLTPAEGIALAIVHLRGVASDIAIGTEIAERWPNGEREHDEFLARGRRIGLQLVQAGELEESPRTNSFDGHYYYLPAAELAAAA